MIQQSEFSIVDVFAETAGAGNQLAVVEDAATLSSTDMQSIAREFNFSETTFICSRGDDSARVRIFTPGEELPFAGHPTLGTAWVLTRGAGSITLELGAGRVPVEIDAGIAWMVPPQPEFGAAIPVPEAAAAIGLAPEEIDTAFPPVFARCGPLFRLVAVRDTHVLQHACMAAPPTKSADGAVFAFCRGGHSEDADFAARMFFFDGHSVREDPATGSANTAFAAYLRKLGTTGHVVIEQGFEMGRPSRIYAEIGAVLRIGGRVRRFASGRLGAAG